MRNLMSRPTEAWRSVNDGVGGRRKRAYERANREHAVLTLEGPSTWPRASPEPATWYLGMA